MTKTNFHPMAQVQSEPKTPQRCGQFKIVTQQPKAKELGTGVLSIDKNGDAMFFEGNGESSAQLLATMHRVRVEFAGAAGIMFTGMQPEGFDRSGKQRYSYQEWWLIYAAAPS